MSPIKDSLTYPFRKGGKYILAFGAILMVAQSLVSFAPFAGGIAGIILFGYLCATYFKMIESSSTDGHEAPDFPDVSNLFEEVIWPMLQLAVIALVSFAPLLLLITIAEEHASFMAIVSLGLLGILYFPMATLAVVILGRLSAAGPQVVLPAIFRAGWYYLMSVSLFVALYGMQLLSEHVLAGLFIIKHLVMAVVSMYVLMAQARTLGLIFRDRREELNWI